VVGYWAGVTYKVRYVSVSSLRCLQLRWQVVTLWWQLSLVWLVKQLLIGWLINIPPFFGFQFGRRSWPRPWLYCLTGSSHVSREYLILHPWLSQRDGWQRDAVCQLKSWQLPHKYNKLHLKRLVTTIWPLRHARSLKWPYSIGHISLPISDL